MFPTRLKTALTLLFLAFALATSFLFIGPTHQAAAASAGKASSVPDFSLSANPTSQTIPRGQTAIYHIHVQGVNGFNGTVTFTFTGRPNHDSGFFTNTSVTGTGDTEFRMHSAGHQSAIGSFTLTVIGTSGSLQHSIQVIYTVAFVAQDFSLAVNPTAQTLAKGGTALYDLHVQDLNGFNGTVTLTIDSGPTPDSLFFTNASVTGTGDTTFEVQSAGQQSVLGTFTVTLIADSGGLEHRIQVTYTIQ